MPEVKLVAKGKVLDDLSKTLKDYKLGDGSFIVVMKEKVSHYQILYLSKLTNHVFLTSLNLHRQTYLKKKSRKKKKHRNKKVNLMLQLNSQ